MNYSPMLAKSYQFQNPRGYWLSEKLDGVRAVWTGERFLSRNGNEFPAPREIVEAMPAGVVLDGELFGGRGTFQATVGKVRSGEWAGVSFHIFDCISAAPFEERHDTLGTLSLPAFCQIVTQTKCRSAKHLRQFEEEIAQAGGEGVMLRKPGSRYSHSRSPSLLKSKRFRCDEGEVIGVVPGNGKFAGKMGALIVKFCGKKFRVGTGFTVAERETPPALGATITFSFFELTDSGVPRFPSFVAVRDYE